MDSIEQICEGEHGESFCKIDLPSKVHQDKIQNFAPDINEPGLVKVLVISVLEAWKKDMSSVLFSLRNCLQIVYKTCKLYVVTLLFLAIYIPIFFTLGGIFLMGFFLLLGFLPFFGGMLIVPLVLSITVTTSACIGWHIGLKILENFRQSPGLYVAAHLCDRVKRFHLMKNLRLFQQFIKIVPMQQQEVGSNSLLDRQNSESTNIQPKVDHDNQHSIENISPIQNERNLKQLPVYSLTDVDADWDDIDDRDYGRETIVHERSPDISPRTSANCKSKEGFPDFGIGGIQKLKCTQDILSEMKRYSKPHILK